MQRLSAHPLSMDIVELTQEIALVNSAASLLSWDQETNLPTASGTYRGQQLAYLAAHAHQLSTASNYHDALAHAEEEDSLESLAHTANLRELRRRSARASQIPTALVAQESAAQSAAHHAWIDARKRSDFSTFKPHLEILVDFARQKAELWKYQSEPYDALLEDYERGTSTSSIADLFDDLLPELRPIAEAATSRTAKEKPKLPAGPYPVKNQMDFNSLVAAEMGFDFRAGRIDTTIHPFCTTLGPEDVRLTTRYLESDFTSSLFGIMHEAGHGLYEQGLPSSDFGLPSGTAVSLGIHESQSRLWENQIGRSPEFWEKFYPIATKHFPQLKDFPIESFLQYIHRAEYSSIRVEADEATYDLHIILRFRIERLLLNQDITAADVPEVWNRFFEESFGFAPKDDAAGCLQDIHWSMGGIGYFPTYTLGNINAAQLFNAAKQDLEISQACSAANYKPLLGWLQENIHRHGSTYDPPNLMKRATGQLPSTQFYLNHLKSRYL